MTSTKLHQIDWLDALPVEHRGQALVTAGNLVKTNYNTGPYRVIKVDGPCRCSSYHDELAGLRRPSPEHFHITVHGPRGDKAWLNGYTLQGDCVWSNDRLVPATLSEWEEAL